MSNAWSAILLGTNKDNDALVRTTQGDGVWFVNDLKAREKVQRMYVIMQVSQLEMRGRIQTPRVAEAMRKVGPDL